MPQLSPSEPNRQPLTRGTEEVAVSEVEQREGSVAAAITEGLVRLHKQYYGKGPTKAKTYLVNDTVICLLEGGLTVVEKTLIDEGNAGAVENIRRSFQSAMETRFKHVVEESTGRSVIAYISQINAEPELALEVFLLEPGPAPFLDEHELRLQDAGADAGSRVP